MLGYFGTALVLWGTSLLADRRTVGWAVCAAGDALWITHGVMSGDHAVYVCESLFLLMRVRAWRRWRSCGTVQP